MTKNWTRTVEDTLALLKQAEHDHEAARAEMKWCDDKTQDILHELELLPHSYHERSRLAKELSEVRQRRRAAKDTFEALGPLVAWRGNHKAAIDALTRVLGDMRKQDEKRANRLYYKRADGSHEIIGRQEDQEDNAT